MGYWKFRNIGRYIPLIYFWKIESIFWRNHVFRLVYLRLNSAIRGLVYITLQEKADIPFLYVNMCVLVFQVSLGIFCFWSWTKRFIYERRKHVCCHSKHSHFLQHFFFVHYLINCLIITNRMRNMSV
jgi:hypothetical protein